MKYAHHTSLEMSVISHIHVRHPPFWISFGQLYFVCVVGEGNRVVSNKDHEFYFEIHENIVFGYLGSINQRPRFCFYCKEHTLVENVILTYM